MAPEVKKGRQRPQAGLFVVHFTNFFSIYSFIVLPAYFCLSLTSDGNEPGSAGLQARARRGFARLDSGLGSVFLQSSLNFRQFFEMFAVFFFVFS